MADMRNKRAGGHLTIESRPAISRVRARVAALVIALFAATLLMATPLRAEASPLEDVGTWFVNTGDAVMQFFGLADEPAPLADFEQRTVADPSTQFAYRDLIGNDDKGYVTENVGRIWPDKTVSTSDITITPGTVSKDSDEDFLVMLSALSSTSNTTTMESKPLDIVMVFDVSGSMGYSFGTE